MKQWIHFGLTATGWLICQIITSLLLLFSVMNIIISWILISKRKKKPVSDLFFIIQKRMWLKEQKVLFWIAVKTKLFICFYTIIIFFFAKDRLVRSLVCMPLFCWWNMTLQNLFFHAFYNTYAFAYVDRQVSGSHAPLSWIDNETSFQK